ncbi:hypothetical protein PIIN_04700 [Serendipita indica DSM 11827]|uniref:F-box domain-containing protein n=1 Tax=Serendipita indica (strain DSM 11827) TaxID=1109443 RepID=G4THH2_SERID|nr:hypothetical protein PIIN_04700 [Serendipita indica DSM 11827]
MSSSTIQPTNRVPTLRERAEIRHLINQDQEDVVRLTNTLEALEKKSIAQKGFIHNYEEALAIAEAMRRVAEKTRDVMAESENMLQPHDADTSVKSEGQSYHKHQRLFRDAQATRRSAVEEAQKATRKIAEMDASIRDIQQEIKGEQSVLAVLEMSMQSTITSIERVKADIALKEAVISARHFVPVEIWRDIFSFRVSEDEALFYDNKRKGIPPFTALKLSAVCRYWRDIVTSSAELWKYIAVPHHDRITVGQRDRITYYHNQCTPLLPEVYTYYHACDGIPVKVNLVTFMRETFAEYQTLDMFIHAFSLMRGPSLRSFLELLSPKANILQLSGIHNPGYTFDIAVDSIRYVKHLKITNKPVSIAEPSHGAPTIPLISFTLDSITLNESLFTGSLSSMSHLERLYLVNVTLNIEGPIISVTMPALKHLTCDLHIYPTISRFITSPRLDDLTLVIKPMEDSTMRDFDEWLGRGGERHPHIHNLTLQALHSEEFEIRNLDDTVLDHFPDVKHLRLSGTTPSSNLLSSPTSVNSLAHIMVLTIIGSAISEEELASFMRGFAALHGRTPKLAVLNCSNLNIQAIARLQNQHY